MDYLFTSQSGEVIDTLECADVDQAYKAAIRFAAQHQTRIVVAVHSFEIEKLVCDCGETMELHREAVICPTCEAQPPSLSPLWSYRPAVTEMMTRHSIDRETAAEMYRMKD